MDEGIGMHPYYVYKNVERRSSTTERKRHIIEICQEQTQRKRARMHIDYLDTLPDDLVICILSKLSSSATTPMDLGNALLTCKRLNRLGLHQAVLSQASTGCLAIQAKNWSDSAQRFLQLCVEAGNLEACYILGMIRFYCLHNRASGASLMAKAAIGLHTSSLYSLAIIQFNGSGGTKNDKDLRAGVALCARSASLGHIDALRELGHCLQDGYGVRRNIKEGRRLLFQANTFELAAAAAKTSSIYTHTNVAVSASSQQQQQQQHHINRAISTESGIRLASLVACPLLSDYGCNLPAQELHPANKFLVDWFSTKGLQGESDGLRLCSHSGCGRPETRRHEFRRCAVCGAVNYCSRACQALDWKLCHKLNCQLLARLVLHGVQLDNYHQNVGDVDDVVDSVEDSEVIHGMN